MEVAATSVFLASKKAEPVAVWVLCSIEQYRLRRNGNVHQVHYE